MKKLNWNWWTDLGMNWAENSLFEKGKHMKIYDNSEHQDKTGTQFPFTYFVELFLQSSWFFLQYEYMIKNHMQLLQLDWGDPILSCSHLQTKRGKTCNWKTCNPRMTKTCMGMGQNMSQPCLVAMFGGITIRINQRFFSGTIWVGSTDLQLTYSWPTADRQLTHIHWKIIQPQLQDFGHAWPLKPIATAGLVETDGISLMVATQLEKWAISRLPVLIG